MRITFHSANLGRLNVQGRVNAPYPLFFHLSEDIMIEIRNCISYFKSFKSCLQYSTEYEDEREVEEICVI